MYFHVKLWPFVVPVLLFFVFLGGLKRGFRKLFVRTRLPEASFKICCSPGVIFVRRFTENKFIAPVYLPAHQVIAAQEGNQRFGHF
jgi:hypothetical protein